MEERLVPVGMITDVTYSQGCLQRLFGLEQLTIRTAGSMIGEGGRAVSTTMAIASIIMGRQRDVCGDCRQEC
jgi:membrane protein YdbS with pleckstrin-like domain